MTANSPAIRRRSIVGVPLATVDYQAALDVIDELIDSRCKSYVIACAVHAAMVAGEDPAVMDAMQHATMVVPDGMPLVWAARALGEPVRDRVYGPTLMLRQCERAACRSQRIYFFGGRNQETLEQLTQRMSCRFPGLDVVGAHAPAQATADELATPDTANAINAAAPDIVYVGLGCPRQELWMAKMRPLLDAPVLIGVGAAFDFHAGRRPQAPAWMQRNGLEWAYRVATEPRRLGPRYLRYNPRFVAAFARQFARERLRGR